MDIHDELLCFSVSLSPSLSPSLSLSLSLSASLSLCLSHSYVRARVHFACLSVMRTCIYTHVRVYACVLLNAKPSVYSHGDFRDSVLPICFACVIRAVRVDVFMCVYSLCTALVEITRSLPLN